ncbi:hypothetical protein DFQ27_004596 [Actinomortierella ambigua]|uniref:Uncharacterized protein n=1 Tax=Actinomortierella ambigua TaxID=1343610 RepID=A0A9P6U3X5_9FUNG|nr:hypothetical protein DFQ27_004596 [Actinomortierella ambigua]
MVRLALLTVLIALVVLSTATALKFDYDVRIYNRAADGWVNGCDEAMYCPMTVEEKSAGPFGTWIINEVDEEVNTVRNQGTKYPVVVLDPDEALGTFVGKVPPAVVRLENVDVSAYRIKDLVTDSYWTRKRNQIFLRPLDPSDDNQIWEFRPAGFDEEFAFW